MESGTESNCRGNAFLNSLLGANRRGEPGASAGGDAQCFLLLALSGPCALLQTEGMNLCT